jgi:hypothetical protein
VLGHPSLAGPGEHSHLDQEDMLKNYAALGAAVAALAAATPATTGVVNSSEPVRTMLDPSADNTDVYAFTAPDAQGKVTAASNWVQLAEPAGGPTSASSTPRRPTTPRRRTRT